MKRVRLRVLTGVAAVMVLVLAACGGGSGGSGELAGPTKSLAPAVRCAAKDFGPVTRCENFYTDYWPTVSANLQSLYQQALKTDDGNLVIWGWYELNPGVLEAFNRRFPGLKVKTRGFTYNLSSAIISAKATGARNTDVVSGSLTSMTAMYDQGFWEKIDWASFGVPKEWFTFSPPELLPNSINGALLSYNTQKAPTPPTSYDDLLTPKWQGRSVMASYEAQDFTGYGMKYGKDRMVQLIKDLKGRGGLTVTDNPGPLLASGDKPIMINGPQFDPNPSIGVAPIQADNTFLQFYGINRYAKNKPAAELFALWSAYDPDWLRTRLTDPRFVSEQVPFPGLPDQVFAEATGILRRNMDALFKAVDNGWAIFETKDNRDQYNDLTKAANAALGR